MAESHLHPGTRADMIRRDRSQNENEGKSGHREQGAEEAEQVAPLRSPCRSRGSHQEDMFQCHLPVNDKIGLEAAPALLISAFCLALSVLTPQEMKTAPEHLVRVGTQTCQAAEHTPGATPHTRARTRTCMLVMNCPRHTLPSHTHRKCWI